MPYRTSPISDPFRAELAAFDRIRPMDQAFHIKQLLRRASTPDEFEQASRRWSALKEGLRRIEEDKCSSGDLDLGMDIVGDLVSAPLDILISASRIVLHFAAGEKDELIDALKDAFEAAKAEAVDRAVGKAGTALDRGTAAARRKAADRLREALIRYLQTWKRRSRRHYATMVDRIFGLVKTGARTAGATVTAAGILLSPSRIGHDLCGVLADGDRAHDEAFRRVHGIGPLP